MHRTQIYLSSEERQGLQALARQLGRSQSDLIREAIDASWSDTDPASASPGCAGPGGSGVIGKISRRLPYCAGNLIGCCQRRGRRISGHE
jgi:hypothetical protein